MLGGGAPCGTTSCLGGGMVLVYDNNKDNDGGRVSHKPSPLSAAGSEDTAYWTRFCAIPFHLVMAAPLFAAKSIYCLSTKSG